MPASPVRVCYLISHFHPNASGAERQALAQGRELVRRGHQVRVVTRHIPGSLRDESMDGVIVHRWIRPVDLGPAFAISFVSGAIRALRKLRPSYDLIHTHQALWESVATGLGRDFLGGAPVLIQPASAGYYGEAEEMARTRGSRLLRRLSLRNPYFASISGEIERQWLALGVSPARMVRTASGVDADHFRPGPSLIEPLLPPRPRVLFTGRLHPQKNLDVLLDIWPEVVAATRAHLLLLGHGPEREHLAERADRLGVASHVHFLGRVADPVEHLRAADVFVLPSVAEGMSNSLLEAMATALPCIASAIGGNSDLLAPGAAGRLVPPADSDAWRIALLDLIEDRAAALRLGAAARSRVESEFALPVVVDRYVELYRRMLARPRGPWIPA